MSTALAVAGVSAVLRDLLNDGLVNHDVSAITGSTVMVSVLPPDRVVPSDGSEATQLNLFLHQVTPNPGWRNEGLPSRDATGRRRLANPPLALDLHYLLSAYGASDLHGEILLGYAMQLLHENPVITRPAIRTALQPSPDVGVSLPPALRALADSGLADQIEQLRITPEHLDTDAMSKLWTAIQSSYRPTAAYHVSVVLIESTAATRAPLPVLARGGRDPVTQRERGVTVAPDLVPPVPTLESVEPSGGQPVARLGEDVDLVGHHLDGTGREAVLRNERFAVAEALAATNAGTEAGRLRFEIPVARGADFPVGVYRVGARVVRPAETAARATNELALVLAPEITNLPLAVARDGAGTASFSLSFRPELRAGQEATLILGEDAYAPEPFTPPAGSLDFVIERAPEGSHLARLRVDGIESPIIDRGAEPPVFFDFRVTVS